VLEHWWSTFGEVTPLDRGARAAGEALWRRRFASPVSPELGAGAFRGPGWQVFSEGQAAHLRGPAAAQALAELPRPQQYTVWSDTMDTGAFQCTGAVPAWPELAAFLEAMPARFDLYLADSEVRWTFVAPHETELGPYFAWPPGVDD
jgi:hypothetical protein